MVTLEELVEFKKLTGQSDIAVIRDFFIQNDMEAEAITMMADLSTIKMNKLNTRIRNFKTWAPILPSEYLYENYDLDTATRLHRMELAYLADDMKTYLEWAKENIPKIKKPFVYFQPLVEYLKEQGIKFKE